MSPKIKRRLNIPWRKNLCDKGVGDMNFWLCRIDFEAKKRDGSNYPPKTIYQLCCRLDRALAAGDRGSVEIFDDHTPWTLG